MSVSIVLSDRSWILEKLAVPLSESLSYVNCIDPSEMKNCKSDVFYYFTYGCYEGRKSPTQMAFFTHDEIAPKFDAAKKKFYDTASEMDLCICMSSLYQDKIMHSSKTKVTIIPPFVDKNYIHTRLSVGVVGRTYKTGRKGESLISELKHLDFIDWYFTGDGWPEAGLNLKAEEMAAFYAKLDIVLVPSLYEGGPMSVPEGHYCGVKVIAPDIGWVKDFVQPEFLTGDKKSLEMTLRREYLKKKERYVLNPIPNIDNWIEKHDRIFNRYIHKRSIIHKTQDRLKIGILLHGSEHKDKGGPSSRAPRLVDSLKLIGHSTTLMDMGKLAGVAENYDVIHIFNLWPPEECINTILRAKQCAKRIILSTIYLDLSSLDFAKSEFIDLAKKIVDISELSVKAMKGYAESVNAYSTEYGQGYKNKIRLIVQLVDEVICLSNTEKTLLSNIVDKIDFNKIKVIPNPVPLPSYDNERLIDIVGNIKEFILNVGRIEPRKNQLSIALALKNTGRNLLLIGEIKDKKYADLIRSIPGVNVYFTGRLEINSGALKDAFSKAILYCHPSFSEGSSLAIIEAYFHGCPLVLSDIPVHREIYKDKAILVHPVNVSGLKEALISKCSRRSQSDLSYDEFILPEGILTFDDHVEASLNLYQQSLSGVNPGNHLFREKNKNKNKQIFLDCTTLAHHKGVPAGIARVELAIAKQLLNSRANIRLVAWNGDFEGFVELKSDFIFKEAWGSDTSLGDYFINLDIDNNVNKGYWGKISHFEPNAVFFVFGGGWIRNATYTKALVSIAQSNNTSLAILIHDLIQWTKCELYGAAASTFISNASQILKFSDLIFYYSHSTGNEIQRFCKEMYIAGPRTKKIWLGSDKFCSSIKEKFNKEILEELRFNFILCVNALDVRKNHIFLLSVWDRLFLTLGEKTPTLVLVGKESWGSESIICHIEAVAKRTNRVLWLNNLTDQDLHSLYTHAILVLNPSLAEGWGLPVSESLNYGKVCITSNISSLNEISPEFTVRLDPTNIEEWFLTIKAYLLDDTLRKIHEDYIEKSFKPLGWTGIEKIILEDVDFLTKRQHSPLFLVSSHIQINSTMNSNDASKILIDGWYQLEKEGVWSKGQSSRILIHCSKNGFKSCKLQLVLKPLRPNSRMSLSAEKYTTFLGNADEIIVSILHTFDNEPSLTEKIEIDINFPDAVAECFVNHKTSSKRLISHKLIQVGVIYPDLNKTSNSSHLDLAKFDITKERSLEILDKLRKTYIKDGYASFNDKKLALLSDQNFDNSYLIRHISYLERAIELSTVSDKKDPYE